MFENRFIGYKLDLVNKTLRMTSKNKNKLFGQITEFIDSTGTNHTIETSNLEKLLGTLNFAANMTHLGRTKIHCLLKEFLGAKDRKEE